MVLTDARIECATVPMAMAISSTMRLNASDTCDGKEGKGSDSHGTDSRKGLGPLSGRSEQLGPLARLLIS